MEGRVQVRVAWAAMVLALAVGAGASVATASTSGVDSRSSGGRIIVGFKQGTGDVTRAAVSSRVLGLRVARSDALGADVIQLPAGVQVADALRRYRADRNVEYVERDVRMRAAAAPNDPQYPAEWGMPAISAPAGWDISTGDTSTIVGIVDTGVSAHAEFGARLLKGYDFVNDDADASDDEGHGTSVAGIIGAAGNNAIGMAGMDWRTRLLPVKVLDDTGEGWTSDIAKGVKWAADNGARVINMSLGGPGNSTTLKRAVAYAVKKGVVVVAAAGNEATTTPSYPAAYPGVLSVAALDGSKLAYFSNWGSSLGVAAPGMDIMTIDGTGYSEFSGTSAAAPFVSGLAGLIAGRNPVLKAAEVSAIITSTADDLGDRGYDRTFGWGRIDVAAALAATPEGDKKAPVVSLTAPSAGKVKGNVKVSATAADNVGVVNVTFWVDGKLAATDKTAPYSWTWKTKTYTKGKHTIAAKGVDAAGNTGTSKTITVTVAN